MSRRIPVGKLLAVIGVFVAVFIAGANYDSTHAPACVTSNR